MVELQIMSHYNGCGTDFGVTQAIICGTGGLVIAHHNKICDELLYLDQQAFTPVSVHAKPLFHKIHTRSEKDIFQRSDKDKETRGDLMIQGLWD